MKKIPLVVIKRLPRYQRVLTELATRDLERISSQELAAMMKITASQLRQDLNYFGSFGQQGYGYRITELLTEVNQILGLNYGTSMILIGAGFLGKALINYESFKRRGFVIKAVFDCDPAIVGKTVNGITVSDVSTLAAYLQQNPTEIGIICTPAKAAPEVAETLCKSGIRGIWNFAPVTLKVPEQVFVEHVHISESLMVLSFKIRRGDADAD
jgi:redox-sensing transcriptional repressor